MSDEDLMLKLTVTALAVIFMFSAWLIASTIDGIPLLPVVG